jgi:methylmalonyl-CoA mutase
MRRLIQAQGAEVVHLGHNRSVGRGARRVAGRRRRHRAVSSYQGGHNEYFRYMVDMLRERGAGHIRVFGGGGGTITPEEIARAAEAYGVERIYHPNDGMQHGPGRHDRGPGARVHEAGAPPKASRVGPSRKHAAIATIDDEIAIARDAVGDRGRRLSPSRTRSRLRKEWQLAGGKVPVIGITGTGGAGKSSLTDELLRASAPASRRCASRCSRSIPRAPHRRRAARRSHPHEQPAAENLYMRSMATRRQHLATSAVLKRLHRLPAVAGFDLVLVETAGIGQSDSRSSTWSICRST